MIKKAQRKDQNERSLGHLVLLDAFERRVKGVTRATVFCFIVDRKITRVGQLYAIG